MLEVNSDISIPLREFDISFARSPGPGGQNVNKVNTKVILRWDVTSTSSLPDSVRERFLEQFKRRITKQGEIIVTSTRFRDQGRNVGDALQKLRQLILQVAEEPKPRKKRRRSPQANRKRLENKRIQSAKKERRKPPKMD